MKVRIDTNVLTYMFDDEPHAPIDVTTGQKVFRCRERVDFLVSQLSKSQKKLIIPAPVLAEVIVNKLEIYQPILEKLSSSRFVEIAPFDTRAALEHAIRTSSGAGKALSQKKPGWKIKTKFDDQIIAIAKVYAVETIYSDDPDIVTLAKREFTVLGIKDLPLPPEDPQFSLPV